MAEFDYVAKDYLPVEFGKHIVSMRLWC